MKFVDYFRALTHIPTRKSRSRNLTFDCLEGKLLLSTYYVATTGSNTAAGTATAPWATIQQAAQNVKPGDTVYVAPGTYTISAEGINTTTSGTAGAPITFISTVKWGAQLYNPGGITQEQVWNNTGDFVTIQGFDMSGDGANGVWAGINNTGSYCQFMGNYVHDIAIPSGMTTGGSGGIGTWQVDALGGHNTIVGNLVVRIGTPGGGNLWHGIYEEGPYAYIANNICAYNMSTGITDGWYSTNTQIVNNVCIGNGNAGIWIGGDDVTVEDYDVVANNICAYNPLGIYEDSDSGTIGYHNQYLNNCVYENSDGGIIQQSGDLYPASGTVTGNPQFVNYQANGTGNYQLASNSPCIGAGTSTDMPRTDFLGVIRPASGPYDIGPYQYSASTILPTVTSEGPGNNATGVSVSTSCVFTFNEPVQTSTIVLTLKSAAGSIIPTSFAYNTATNTVTFTPTANLAYSTTYTAIVSGARDMNGNFMAQLVTETFTTASAPATNATINVTSYNVTYTGTAHSATGAATGGSGVNLASGLTINSTHTNAGKYTDSWSFNEPKLANGAPNPNYNPNYTTLSGTITDIIVPAPLIVSANNETMVQGSTVPTLTISYKGFVDGQTAANLPVKPTATTTVSKRSAPGKYVISVKGAVDPNYTTSYVPAIMTVTKKHS